MLENFELGDIVMSKAGHDKKKLFVIAQIVNQQFVLIVNGTTRSINNPKIKRTKHLRLVIKNENLAVKITNAMLENKDIVNELKCLTQKCK